MERDVFQEVRKRLEGCPGIQIVQEASSITVIPAAEDGFPARLDADLDGFTVSFAGWHERFESLDEAVACFFWGLS